MASEKIGYNVFPVLPVTGPVTSVAFNMDTATTGANVILTGTAFSARVQVSNAIVRGGPAHLFIPADASFDTAATLNAASPPTQIPGPFRYIRIVLDSGTLNAANIEETHGIAQSLDLNAATLAGQTAGAAAGTAAGTAVAAVALAATVTPALFRFSQQADQSTAGLVALLAARGAASGKSVIDLENVQLTISAPLDIDLSKVRLIGRGAKITSTHAGVALHLDGSAAPPYTQADILLDGIELIGPSQLTGSVGVYVHGTFGLNTGAAHWLSRGIIVHGYETGVKYGDHAYALTHLNWQVYNNALGVDSTAGFDAGEECTWLSSKIFNNAVGVRQQNPNGNIVLIGCSIDYNTSRHFTLTAGMVTCTACHIEASTYAAPAIVLTGNSALTISQGWLLLTGTAPHAMSALFDVEAGSSVSVRDVRANNLLNTAKRLHQNAGLFRMTGTASFPVTNLSPVTGFSSSNLGDGQFTNASITDDWYITDDTQPITSQLTGTNIILTRQAAGGVGGTSSLRAVKAFGSGSPASFSLLAPLRQASALMGFALSFAKDAGTGGGTVYLASDFVRLRGWAGTAGAQPTVAQNQSIGASTIVFTTAASGHTAYFVGEPLPRTPAWATHLRLTFNLTSYAGPDPLYIDDVIVSEM